MCTLTSAGITGAIILRKVIFLQECPERTVILSIEVQFHVPVQHAQHIKTTVFFSSAITSY